MSEQRYAGGCQCGAVTFEADLDLDHTLTCNCSRCQRLGAVLAFTSDDKFTLKTGAENLTQFTFNTNSILHQFCKTCGIEPFAFGTRARGPQNGGRQRQLPRKPRSEGAQEQACGWQEFLTACTSIRRIRSHSTISSPGSRPRATGPFIAFRRIPEVTTLTRTDDANRARDAIKINVPAIRQ